MKHWYALYTKPNAEYQVATALQERGLETYLPEIEAPKTRQGRERKPFFPCYLFIKVDFETIGLSQVRWTSGLRRIVAFDGRPAPVPDQVINLIRRHLEGLDAAGGRPAHTFQPGDTLRVTAGPLQDMLAVFDRPTTSAERVQVLLTFLGHARRTWVPVTDLEKVLPEGEATVPKRLRRTRGRGRRIKSN